MPLGDMSFTYNEGCSYYAVMCIHSALSQRYYGSLKDFIDELKNNDTTRKYVTEEAFSL
jgi:hypothetical protein